MWLVASVKRTVLDFTPLASTPERRVHCVRHLNQDKGQLRLCRQRVKFSPKVETLGSITKLKCLRAAFERNTTHHRFTQEECHLWARCVFPLTLFSHFFKHCIYLFIMSMHIIGETEGKRHHLLFIMWTVFSVANYKWAVSSYVMLTYCNYQDICPLVHLTEASRHEYCMSPSHKILS